MQALGLFSEKKIILLHLQASGLNTSNVGFGLVFTTEFKLQAFNSKIGSMKTKKNSDYEIEIYRSFEFPGFELSDFVIVRALVLITYYKIEEQESERYRRNGGEISYSFICIVTHTKAPYL